MLAQVSQLSAARGGTDGFADVRVLVTVRTGSRLAGAGTRDDLVVDVRAWMTLRGIAASVGVWTVRRVTPFPIERPDPP